MTLREFAREVFLPVTMPAVFLALLMFFGLFQIALLGTVFGLVIALVLAAQLVIFVLPALQRTLMQLLEARSLGREPVPPTIESFSWVGSSWTLFPVVHAGMLVYLYFIANSPTGDLAFNIIAAVYALLLPASLMLLAVTQSVLESINPRAILYLLRQLGSRYLVGPLFLFASVAGVSWLIKHIDYDFVAEFAGFYLLFASFAVFGGMVRPLALRRQLVLPDVPPSPAKEFPAQLALVRGAALNHAYGLISRGNRTAGLEHLFDELAVDADAAAGWHWYFDQLMRWENNTAGLAFAQHYIHDLLRNGDYVGAVKVMLRCHLVNPAFKPLAEDLPEAIAAAEECRNDDLVRALRS